VQNEAGTRGKKWHKSDTSGSPSVHAAAGPEKQIAAPTGIGSGDNTIEKHSEAFNENCYHGGASGATRAGLWYAENRNVCPRPIVTRAALDVRPVRRGSRRGDPPGEWGAAMSAYLEVSVALLKSRLVNSPPSDPELIAGYASGEITTLAARPFANRAVRRFQGRFTRPRPQRSPDRERSIHRRRMLAATWPMPPVMAGMLTTSQVAYARIVADEVHRSGRCELTLDEIAARGGMCRKTAKRAQDRLAELAWITVEERPVEGRKHLSNVVRIVSHEWSTWIKMGPKPRRIGGHLCPTTGNQSLYPATYAPVERAQGAYERERAGPTQPPGDRRNG
jgi:hypothetical protein